MEMARPKVHGGFTIDRVAKHGEYWTCRHIVSNLVDPPVECPICKSMATDALIEYLLRQGLTVTPGETVYAKENI